MSWSPAAHIPAWAREATLVAKNAPPLALPGGAKVTDAEHLGDLADRCLNGDASAGAMLLARARDLAGSSRDYVTAIALLAVGGTKEAEIKLDAVMKADPSFVPAHALRGMIHLFRREKAEARKDFEWTKAKDPSVEWSWTGLMALALGNGDLSAVTKLSGEASKAGVSSPEIEALANCAQRTRRGPLWSTVYEVDTNHYRIRSDHSEALCHEVARILESALISYSHCFPDIALPTQKWPVYVFATREGFLAYTKDRMSDMENAAGFYDERTRELVFFLGVDRNLFIHTVRHEAFHGFLSEVLAVAPTWFNEGCAEYFGAGRKLALGGYAPGGPNPEAAAMLKAPDTRLIPLARLLRMSHEEFMGKDAALCYAESWAFVRFLMTQRSGPLRDVLREYLAALRQGLTAKAAYAKVFSPIEAGLEDAFHAYLSTH